MRNSVTDRFANLASSVEEVMCEPLPPFNCCDDAKRTYDRLVRLLKSVLQVGGELIRRIDTA